VTKYGVGGFMKEYNSQLQIVSYWSWIKPTVINWLWSERCNIIMLCGGLSL
jgi:hypothetical protein